MDIQLKKKPWYRRHKYYLAGGVLFLVFVGYVVRLALAPQQYRVSRQDVRVARVERAPFLEYIDANGTVAPILTIKVNAGEGGNVARVVGGEGNLLRQGDTILVLENTELLRDIAEQDDELQRQLMTYREQEIEMQQKSINLQQQALENEYELRRLGKEYAQNQEEYGMDIISKAQLELSAEEYEHKVRVAALQRESLRQDSAATALRRRLIRADMSREQRKFERARDRLDRLVVTAPMAGQLSYVGVTPGQKIAAGESVAEIKVLDRYKVQTAISEFYIDRFTTGLPASLTYRDRKYVLHVTKVVPEVTEGGTFAVDLVFDGEVPDNVRVGKSLRLQIELGQPEESVVIPRGDFYAATGGRWIYKLNAAGDKAVKVPVTIGRQNPQQYEVVEGLRPGDQVLVTGYARFGDAEEVLLAE